MWRVCDTLPKEELEQVDRHGVVALRMGSNQYYAAIRMMVSRFQVWSNGLTGQWGTASHSVNIYYQVGEWDRGLLPDQTCRAGV